jgi:hypothetical protein
MNLVTERRLQTEAPPLGKTGDEVEFAGRRWRWNMVVDKTAVDSMRRMDVSVRMADATEDSSLASVTGFFGSAIAPAGTSAPWPDVGPQAGQPAENGGEEEAAQDDEQRPTIRGRRDGFHDERRTGRRFRGFRRPDDSGDSVNPWYLMSKASPMVAVKSRLDAIGAHPRPCRGSRCSSCWATQPRSLPHCTSGAEQNEHTQQVLGA